MKKFFFLFFCAVPLALSAQQTNQDSLFIAQLYSSMLTDGEAYEDLRFLCKNIGHRLAGSEQAMRAIEWGENVLKEAGCDRVYLMPVEVPHWTRGQQEIGYILDGKEAESIPVKALGGSVGTGGKLTAPVIMVKSIEELQALSNEAVKGKIVFINKPMNPALINTGAAYGGAYDIRSKGASESAKKGAVACLIRSLSTADDRFPHTGAMAYEEGVAKIPAAALSTVDAYKLSQLILEKKEISFSLEMDCVAYDRVIQYNVIGEITGKENPNQYIVVGGHLDSWDIGEGAHDDGAGIVQSIEIMRTFKRLNYVPNHTVRCVLFINEEFGNDGGETYASVAKEKSEEHLAAIESDGGGFSPRGFNMDGSDAQLARLESWIPMLESYGVYFVKRGWSGVDISPLKNGRTALYGLSVDPQRYFDYHHSDNDRFENVNKRELLLGSATMASLIYLIDLYGVQ